MSKQQMLRLVTYNRTKDLLKRGELQQCVEFIRAHVDDFPRKKQWKINAKWFEVNLVDFPDKPEVAIKIWLHATEYCI